jgi:hypothetical protein
MGVSLFNETSNPTIIRDSAGSYCIKDIKCSNCFKNGTASCPGGNSSRPSYARE